MSDLSSIERLKFEALFDMESGYVLDFSNNTFSAFTIENVGIDIFDSKYEYGSSSKANRLRKFWMEESNEVVGKLLSALLDYWLTKKQIGGEELSSKEKTLYDECQKIVNRLNQNSFRQIPKNTSSPSQKGRIFISYRRADSEGYAGRIYDRLALHFGNDAIFMDVDDIPAGVDFVKYLEKEVQSCDALIALIGKQWLNVKDEHGIRRLDDPNDFVRIEIATALKRDIRVIPVLLGGTQMPNVSDLPENLQSLTRRNGVLVYHHSFHADTTRLIKHLEGALGAVEQERQRIANEKVDREAAEKAAKEKAEREAAEKTAREKAEKDAIEKARLEAEEQAKIKAAKEKAESEAAEKASLKAEEEERQRITKKKTERETVEKIAREREIEQKKWFDKTWADAEERVVQKAAKEKAEREAAERAERERKEKELREKQARETGEKAKREEETPARQPSDVQSNEMDSQYQFFSLSLLQALLIILLMFSSFFLCRFLSY